MRNFKTSASISEQSVDESRDSAMLVIQRIHMNTLSGFFSQSSNTLASAKMLLEGSKFEKFNELIQESNDRKQDDFAITKQLEEIGALESDKSKYISEVRKRVALDESAISRSVDLLLSTSERRAIVSMMILGGQLSLWTHPLVVTDLGLTQPQIARIAEMDGVINGLFKEIDNIPETRSDMKKRFTEIEKLAPRILRMRIRAASKFSREQLVAFLRMQGVLGTEEELLPFLKRLDVQTRKLLLEELPILEEVWNLSENTR